MEKQRRKQILIDKSFQLRFLFIWTIMAAGLILSIVVLYFVLRNPTGNFWGLEPALVRTILWVGCFIFTYTLLMGMLSVYLTQKVAGAAYRLKEDAQKLATGDLEVGFSLRKGDYLQDLAGALRELKEVLKTRRAKFEELKKELDELKEQIGDEKSEALQKICEQI